MNIFLTAFLFFFCSSASFAQELPVSFKSLLKYVQAAPNQGESNTCWFVASTGAMELLLNKKENIRQPKKNGKFDLAESFLIHQREFHGEESRNISWLESIVLKFNHGEAIHNTLWPFNAFYEDGTDSSEVWLMHPDYLTLPRITVPPVKTKFLFSRGKNRWSTDVLDQKDIEEIKKALVKYKSPILVNYNDENYWHVVLIVGYDDRVKGQCYELEPEQCNKKGAFYVRDSNGRRYETRAYNWFLHKGNSAAVVELK